MQEGPCKTGSHRPDNPRNAGAAIRPGACPGASGGIVGPGEFDFDGRWRNFQ